MKTRDEQAEEYVKALKEEFGYPELVDVYKAFQKGWDAALKSQWRDAREELPEHCQDVVFRRNDGNLPRFALGYFWKSGKRQGVFKHWDGELTPDQITYWMPIPDLP